MRRDLAPSRPWPPRRVLVLRFGSAGDVVLTTPAVEALAKAWPETEIVYAIRRPFACLVERDPFVSHTVALEEGEAVMAYVRRLKAFECGAILDLHGKARSVLIRWLHPGVPTVVWTKRDWRQTLPVRLGWKTWRGGMLLADRFHQAVEQLVGRDLPRGALAQWVGAAEADEVDVLLRETGILGDRPILGMTPGANWETKRWPAERFAVLAERAVARGYEVVVTGSEAERPLATAIVTRVPAAHDLCGVVSLRQLGALVSRCAAFVANDSGPMHVARALGVPTLAIFGSTDPEQFAYVGHARLFAGVPCAPCHFYGRRSCPLGHFDCMDKLDVEQAWSALEPLLTRGRVGAVEG